MTPPNLNAFRNQPKKIHCLLCLWRFICVSAHPGSSCMGVVYVWNLASLSHSRAILMHIPSTHPARGCCVWGLLQFGCHVKIRQRVACTWSCLYRGCLHWGHPQLGPPKIDPPGGVTALGKRSRAQGTLPPGQVVKTEAWGVAHIARAVLPAMCITPRRPAGDTAIS